MATDVRFSLLLGYAPLCLAATAYAECAWVLWTKADYDAALDGEWTVVQALATRLDRITTLQEMLKPSLEKFKDSAAGDEAMTRAVQAMERAAARGSVLVVGRGQSLLVKCLPDTVDTRGVKGK